MKIMVETSARHVHLSEKDLKILFGHNAELTHRKSLSQPGQYVSYEKVDIVGERGTIQGVSILGPTRSETQVEVSLTDARKLGIKDIPIRNSGHLENTPGCKLIGSNGEIDINHGLIVAKRHIHLSVDEAKDFGLKDGQIVLVKINTNNRKLIFDDVVIKVRNDFSAAMHIDTDEANAACISSTIYGEIIK